MLSSYPNQQLVAFVSSGLTHGFRLGHQGGELHPAARNNKSSYVHSTKVDEAISKEVSRGHTIGPFDNSPFHNFHRSPIGAEPKKDGSVRLVLDLSSPKGFSVNDGIDKEAYSVTYSSLDVAVDIVRRLGQGSYMCKIDIKHAFRICPVHPKDWHKLGFVWKDKYYFDVVLPFGGRSSPFIFNQVANLLHWILVNVFKLQYTQHYLDDFFGADQSFSGCEHTMNSILTAFESLGVPVAPKKVEGPVKTITYLGIEIDTEAQEIRLPKVKLDKLMEELEEWYGRKKCTKRDLLSLIGSLSFACKVVKSGRTFLRRLIDLSTKVTSIHHHIDLNMSAREDILWWKRFLPSWNGVCLIQDQFISSDDLNLFTDASGVGLGGYFNGRWFSTRIRQVYSQNIAYLELLAIVTAVGCWCKLLLNKQIILFTDNEAIVEVWASGTSKNPYIMKLVRELFFISANNNINIILRHIPGKHNTYADLLSRLQVDKFKELCPQAKEIPSKVPEFVWHI